MGLLSTLAVGQLAASRERANRIKCANNLRQFGQALLLYSVDNKNLYPRTAYDPADDAKLNFYTAPDAKKPFDKDGALPNDVAAALYLLVRNCDLIAETFLCPTAQFDRPDEARKTDPWWKNRQLLEMSNFPGRQGLDYSVTQPYPSKSAVARGYKWSPNVSADWAIVADMNPGGKELATIAGNAPADEQKKVNSPNHRRDGQNVLFNDGHVEWCTAVFAGANKDNIYTRAKVRQVQDEWTQLDPPASEEGVQPACALDSVMLPVADQKPTGK